MSMGTGVTKSLRDSVVLGPFLQRIPSHRALYLPPRSQTNGAFYRGADTAQRRGRAVPCPVHRKSSRAGRQEQRPRGSGRQEERTGGGGQVAKERPWVHAAALLGAHALRKCFYVFPELLRGAAPPAPPAPPRAHFCVFGAEPFCLRRRGRAAQVKTPAQCGPCCRPCRLRTGERAAVTPGRRLPPPPRRPPDLPPEGSR